MASVASNTARMNHSALRFFIRVVPVLILLFGGLLTQALLFPIVTLAMQKRIMRRWSKLLLWATGMKLVVRDAPAQADAVMWLSNHISWLDVFALNAVRTAVFVAKDDIVRWPVIGLLVRASGTIFVDRTSRQSIRAVNQRVQTRLAAHELICIFPEGTTSVGNTLLPFHSNLLDPALKAGAIIQPVALRYTQHGLASEVAAYVGEQTLVQNMWLVLGHQGLEVEVQFLATVNAYSPEQTRHAVAALAREAIAQALNVECTEPAPKHVSNTDQ